MSVQELHRHSNDGAEVPGADERLPTAEIFQFIPRGELDASASLQGFITGCRDDLTVFGADLDWEANEWDVSAYIPVRGRKGRLAFVFSNFETAGRATGKGEPMVQPFLDFAKSYMRYQHIWRKTKGFNPRLAALRALEKALTELSVNGVPQVEKTDAHVLNYAVQLIKTKAPGSAYQVASQLKLIGELLVECRCVAVPFVWRNPIKKPDDQNIKVGAKAEARREQMLPSTEALDALGHAFHMAVQPEDVIITSIAALMTCSPDRINELFRLPVNCESEVMHKGELRYGLRWWPSKGAEPMVKPIVRCMVETAKDAIQRILKHTGEARRMALWYEEHRNPGQLYLPQGLEHLRTNERLTSAEISEIIGLPTKKAGSAWAREHELASEPVPRVPGAVGQPMHCYAFKDVERVIVAMLPKGFPVYDAETLLEYSKALILVPRKFFNQSKVNYRCMFETVSTDCVNDQLGARTQHSISSVFSRLKLLDEDGNPFRIHSHQFRHWLNTLAMKKDLDDSDVGMWSGRKDIGQNVYYDHTTPEEILAKLREADISKFSGINVVIPESIPMTRKEFLELQHPTVHTTQYGFCVHNWMTLPCQKQRACLDCTEHLCVKGDVKKTESIRQCLLDAEAQLVRDTQALEDGWLQADRWFAYNTKKVERLRNLVQIFDDPTVPIHTIIKLTNDNEYSPIQMAMNQRELLGDADAVLLGEVRARSLANALAHEPQGGVYV